MGKQETGLGFFISNAKEKKKGIKVFQIPTKAQAFP